MEGAYLQKADLKDATLRRTNLANADMRATNLEQAISVEGANLMDVKGVSDQLRNGQPGEQTHSGKGASPSESEQVQQE